MATNIIYQAEDKNRFYGFAECEKCGRQWHFDTSSKQGFLIRKHPTRADHKEYRLKCPQCGETA